MRAKFSSSIVVSPDGRVGSFDLSRVRKCFLGERNIQRETAVKMFEARTRPSPIAGTLKIDYQPHRRA
jgi:hypothetical protein